MNQKVTEKAYRNADRDPIPAPNQRNAATLAEVPENISPLVQMDSTVQDIIKHVIDLTQRISNTTDRLSGLVDAPIDPSKENIKRDGEIGALETTIDFLRNAVNFLHSEVDRLQDTT